MSIEIGDYVRLKKKAIKDFYGTGDRPLDFVRGGYPTYEKIDSEAFIEFVGTWLSFESGEMLGKVVGCGSSNNDTKVIFFNKIKGEIDHGYYDVNDLKKIKIEV